MEMKLKFKYDNQWNFIGQNFNVSWHDTESIVYAVSLANEVKKLFGVHINIPNTLIEQANYYCGKEVYGNICMPQRMSIVLHRDNTCGLMENYDYEGVKDCRARVADNLTKEEVVNIASELIECLSRHNILEESFISLMSHYKFKIICNAYTIAQKIIAYYKPFISAETLKRGIDICNNSLSMNLDVNTQINI